jgi:hypothetical protein
MAKMTKEFTGGAVATRLWTQEQYNAKIAAIKMNTSLKGLIPTQAAVAAGFESAKLAAARFTVATMRALAPFALMIAAGYAVTHLLERFTGVFGDLEDINALGAIGVDFNDQLQNNTKSFAELAKEIHNYEQQLKNIEDLEGAQYEQRRNQLNDLITTNRMLIGTISEDQFRSNDVLMEQHQEYFGAMQNAADAELRWRSEQEKGMYANKQFIADQKLIALEQQQIADAIRNSESELGIFLRTQNIFTIGEFNEALRLGTTRWAELEDTLGGVAGVSGAVNQEIEDATQLLDSFNNRREELFYGFKAGNLTGDLVRQIEQKGVENFVANTEIIMTNNFNGMTTDQVADEILRKINERAVTDGINLSLNTQ